MTTLLSFLLLAAGSAQAEEPEPPPTWQHPSVLIVGIESHPHAPTTLSAFVEAEGDCRLLWGHFKATEEYPPASILALCEAEKTTRAGILIQTEAWLKTLPTGPPLVVIWMGRGNFGDVLYASDSTIYAEERDGTEISIDVLLPHLEQHAPDGTEIIFLLDATRDAGTVFAGKMRGPTAGSLAAYDSVLAYSLTHGEVAPAGLMLSNVRGCWREDSDVIRADRTLDAAELAWCMKRAGAASDLLPEFGGPWHEQPLSFYSAPLPPVTSARAPLLRRPAVRWGSIGIGAAALLAGGGAHYAAVQWRDSAQEPYRYYEDEAAYSDGTDIYHRYRLATYGLYGLAAASFAVGTVSFTAGPTGVALSGEF